MPLILIHRVASQIRNLSSNTIIPLKGIMNFKIDVKISGTVKKMVFSKYPINESVPLTGEGRKSSMPDTPFFINFLWHS
jgi:hypothetical protein